MNDCVIYRITCNPNGHFYIGQSCEYFKRFWRHINDMRKLRHDNARMQRCFNKYGEESFSIEVLEWCSSSELNLLEQQWIDKCFDDVKCMNLNRNAVKPPNPIGRIMSEETKAKISRANKGLSRSDDFKQQMSKLHQGNQYWVGKTHSEATKQKIREINASTVEKELLSPQKERVKFCNRTQFCLDNHLDRGAINRLLKGKAKSHQGWTKP